MTDKEIILAALDHISEACCFLFETESKEGHMLAFWADSLLKLVQVVARDDEILEAACDYKNYEMNHYKNKKEITDEE